MSAHFASHALAVSVVLFCLGAVVVVVRRNLLFKLMGIEVMLNAAGLAFVAGAAMRSGPSAGRIAAQADGQSFFIFILPVAAAEVAIGLALAVLVFQRFRTLDLNALAKAKEA